MATRERRALGVHQDVIAGIALVALCGAGYWVTTGFTEVPAMLSQNVPPTFFPRLVLGLITILSLILIAAGLRKSREERPELRASVWVTAAIIVVATGLVSVLGTLPTLFLATVVLPIAWGERRFFVVAGLAVALPAAIYLVFTMALGVRFPTGALATLLG